MKSLYTILVALFGMNFGFSQGINFGVKAGLNYSIYTDDGNSVDGFGFHLGGIIDVGISDVAGIRAELLLSDRGVQESSSTTIFGTTYDTKFVSHPVYIAIPILFRYSVNSQLSFMGGPQFSFLLSNQVRSRSYIGNDLFTDITVDGSDAKEFLRELEIGIAFGGEYNLNENMGLGLRYVRGLQSVSDSDNASDFYNGIQASFIYKF